MCSRQEKEGTEVTYTSITRSGKPDTQPHTRQRNTIRKNLRTAMHPSRLPDLEDPDQDSAQGKKDDKGQTHHHAMRSARFVLPLPSTPAGTLHGIIIALAGTARDTGGAGDGRLIRGSVGVGGGGEEGVEGGAAAGFGQVEGDGVFIVVDADHGAYIVGVEWGAGFGGPDPGGVAGREVHSAVGQPGIAVLACRMLLVRRSVMYGFLLIAISSCDRLTGVNVHRIFAVISPPCTPLPSNSVTLASLSAFGITCPLPVRGESVTLFPDADVYITKILELAIWLP